MKRTLLIWLGSMALLGTACSGTEPECTSGCPPIRTEPTPYTSYFTGDEADAQVSPTFGITMMGGRSEHDTAMRWFLRRANGGDVLVLRSTGSDGYNDYLFSELGIQVNSVETLVINSLEAANHEYVLEQIRNAEAIWMAGGNQFDYISFWRNSDMKQALNDHINVKRGVIGGTSAGMAILGEWYYSAENGSIVSREALSNPFDNRLTLDNDFLNINLLTNLVTDTHYANRDRQGRHSAFLARLAQQNNTRVFGIACDEYTAVNISADGTARVYGDAPAESDAVYFIQSGCDATALPEIIESSTPLTWNQNQQALYVYKVVADGSGNATFNLNNWNEGNAGSWHNWYIEAGVWNETPATAPNCN